MTDENSTPAEEQIQQPAHQPDDLQEASQQPAAEQERPAQATQQLEAAQEQAQQPQQAYQQAAPAYQQPVPVQGQPQQVYQQPYQQPLQGQPQQAYQQPMQGQPQQAYQQPMQGQQFYQQPMQGQPQQPYQQPPVQGQPQFYQQPMQGAYGQPPQQAWGQPPAPPQSKRATAALVCGILAIVFSPSVIIGIALGVVALVLVLTPKGQPRDGKMKAGMICGIVGLVLSVAMAIGLAVAYNMAVQEAQRQAAIEAARVPLSERVEGTVIADDAVCTMKITKMEIDDEGNLNVYFTLTNHVAKEINLISPKGKAWEVNGQKADPVVFTWVKPGQTKEDLFTIPESYLPVTNIEDIESVYGPLEVDPGTGVNMPYTLDLY